MKSHAHIYHKLIKVFPTTKFPKYLNAPERRKMKFYNQYVKEANFTHRCSLELMPFTYRHPSLKGLDMLDILEPELNQYVKPQTDLINRPISLKDVVEIANRTKEFKFIEIPGDINDLLEASKQYSIASLFSADMSIVSETEKKIAKHLDIFDSITKYDCRIGQIAKCIKNNQNLYCLFSRSRWWERSSYSALKTCLLKLKKDISRTGNKILFIPRLGYGIDGLDWDDVKIIIKDIFQTTDVKIIALSMKKKNIKLKLQKRIRGGKTSRSLRVKTNQRNKHLKWFTQLLNK